MKSRNNCRVPCHTHPPHTHTSYVLYPLITHDRDKAAPYFVRITDGNSIMASRSHAIHLLQSYHRRRLISTVTQYSAHILPSYCGALAVCTYMYVDPVLRIAFSTPYIRAPSCPKYQLQQATVRIFRTECIHTYGIHTYICMYGMYSM